MDQQCLTYAKWGFAIACCVIVAIALILQTVGTAWIRRGTPLERRGMHLGGGSVEWQTDAQLSIFERELLVDAGHAMIASANLLIFASVLASLAVNFPEWWLVEIVIVAISAIVPPFYSLRGRLRDMRSKRTRMQNGFDLFPTTTPDGVKSRDYWREWYPSFDVWTTQGKWRRSWTLIRQVSRTAKRYKSKEPYAGKA